jgi:hypothetical protein
MFRRTRTPARNTRVPRHQESDSDTWDRSQVLEVTLFVCEGGQRASPRDSYPLGRIIHVWFQPSWLVRTSGPIEGLTGQMQRALADVDPGLPFSGFYSMTDHLAQALATQRVEVALLGAMAGLALLLSALGIFALVANMVAQRTREIGIRIALGSTLRQAMGHVAAPGIRSSAIGVVLGLVLCLGALRTMRRVLYGVGVYDGLSILGVVVVLTLVTLLATAIPTLRIARTNPATTLREE